MRGENGERPHPSGAGSQTGVQVTVTGDGVDPAFVSSLLKLTGSRIKEPQASVLVAVATCAVNGTRTNIYPGTRLRAGRHGDER